MKEGQKLDLLGHSPISVIISQQNIELDIRSIIIWSRYGDLSNIYKISAAVVIQNLGDVGMHFIVIDEHISTKRSQDLNPLNDVDTFIHIRKGVTFRADSKPLLPFPSIFIDILFLRFVVNYF